MASVLSVLAALVLVSAVAMLGAQLALHVAAWRAERRRRVCRDDAERSAAVRGAWAIMREAMLGVLVCLAWPAGAATAAPDQRRPLIVLIHGFASSPVCLWVLARRLRRDGWRVSVPRLGGAWRDLEDAAARIGWHLDRLRDEHGAIELVVAAHGIGGLATRALLHRTGRRAGIRLLITLGTPHGGTSACPWLPIGPLRRDVRPGSAAIDALAAGTLPVRTEAIAISTPGDAFVVPSDGAYWRDACNVSVEGSGHLHLLVSARVYEVVAENLAGLAVRPARRHAD